jgi:hypothetical protein
MPTRQYVTVRLAQRSVAEVASPWPGGKAQIPRALRGVFWDAARFSRKPRPDGNVLSSWCHKADLQGNCAFRGPSASDTGTEDLAGER